MQPYLMYGYGFRAKNLSNYDRERLILIDLNEDIFCWFSEDEAGSADDDAGIYYIISASPWSEELEPRKHKCYPWAANIDEMIDFKEKHAKDIDARLQDLGLLEYKDKLEFLASVTEV